MATDLPEPSTLDTPAEPIHSRFLFVDIAARRAIQLKRGARVRISRGEHSEHAEHAEHDRAPHKLERIAMEEVRQGLIDYSLPELPTSVG